VWTVDTGDAVTVTEVIVINLLGCSG